MLKNLKLHLEENNIFQKTLILKKGPLNNFLLDQTPDLTQFPAGVIAGGPVCTTDGALTGSCNVDVAVITPFYGGLDRELEEGLEILKKTVCLLQCDPRGNVLSLGEYHYILEQVEELDLSDEFLAWRIRLNVKFSLS